MIGYTVLPRPNAFFLCANSGFGFVSHVNEAFSDCNRLYVLKGGPGTGKSRFMEELALAAEECGLPVSRILCSSDPDSLDGVLIEKLKVGIVDGTPPHAHEPTMPGAFEQLLDPGAFWDGDRLTKAKEEIKERNALKKEAYGSALSLIESAKNAALCQQTILSPKIDRDKIQKLEKKLLCAISPSKKRCQTRFLSGIGMKGAVTLDGYLHKAERIVTLTPYFGSEAVILGSISQKLHEKDYSFTLFPCPVTLQPEAIYFEEERLLLRCGKALGLPKEKIIDCKKKIERPSASEKTMLRTLARQENDCLASAGFFFEKMKGQHFALEKIYGDAMDFPALEQFKKETIRRILS